MKSEFELEKSEKQSGKLSVFSDNFNSFEELVSFINHNENFIKLCIYNKVNNAFDEKFEVSDISPDIRIHALLNLCLDYNSYEELMYVLNKNSEFLSLQIDLNKKR